MKSLPLIIIFIVCIHTLVIGQSMDFFNAISGYHWTSQPEKVDSCISLLTHRWKAEGNDLDLATVQWASFLHFDQNSDLPGKTAALHKFDSLFPKPAPTSAIYAIRSIMKGIVLRGSYDPAGLKMFDEAIPIFKKMMPHDILPYVIIKSYQSRSLATLNMIDESVSLLDSLVEFCESSTAVNPEIMTQVYKINGQMHSYLGNIPLASKRYKQAINIIKDRLPAKSSYIAQIDGDQCDCLTSLLLFKKSEDCFNTLFKKIKKLHIDLPDVDLAGLYYNASSPMSFTGNYVQRQEYLLQTIELAKNLNQYTLIAYTYDALAVGSRAQGDYTEALYFSKKSIDILTDENGVINPLGRSLLYSYAHYSSEFGEIQMADSLFNICIEHAESWFLHSDNFSVDYFYLYTQYIDHLERIENPNKAKETTKLIYDYTKKIDDISPSWLTYIEYIIIEDLTNEHKTIEALARLDQLFRSLYIGTNYPNSGTPHPDSLIQVDDLFKLYFFYLKNKFISNTNLNQSHDIPHLLEEISKLKDILRQIKIHGTLDSEQHTISTENIHTYLLYLYQAFYDQTNDRTFLDKLLQLSNELKSGTNEYLIQHTNTLNSDTTQHTLLTQIDALEYLQYDLGERNDHDFHLVLLQEKDSLHKQIIKSRQLLYSRLSEDQSPISLDVIQQAIAKDEVVLDYYFDEKIVRLLLVDRDTAFYTYWQADCYIGKTIEKLYAAQSNLESTAAMASQLYQALLEPIESLVKNKKLVVIPYSQMFYLNFESLSDDKNLRPAYLIDYSSARQIQRINDLLTKHTSSTQQKKTLLAFLPGFNNNLISSYKAKTDPENQDKEYIDLSPLNYISAKIEALKKDLDLIYFKELEAQEVNYHQRAPQAGVIHLASHAVLDNFNPMNSHIFFTKIDENYDPNNDGRLHLQEIANQHLSAKLAILTACNTGKGGIAFGGGPNTLSSSFHLAGVPSVIHTLWNVDEFATADIITKFYKHVLNGMTTNEALRQSKLDFLDQAPLEHQHPYYWAGLVLIGDDTSLTFSRHINWLLWTCLTLFFFSFLWLVRNVLLKKTN